MGVYHVCLIQHFLNRVTSKFVLTFGPMALTIIQINVTVLNCLKISTHFDLDIIGKLRHWLLIEWASNHECFNWIYSNQFDCCRSSRSHGLLEAVERDCNGTLWDLLPTGRSRHASSRQDCLLPLAQPNLLEGVEAGQLHWGGVPASVERKSGLTFP